MVSIAEYKKLKSPRKQIEGQHQSALGQLLNGPYRHRLNPDLIFWTYSGSGEKKGIKTASLQKRKGLQRGDFDYRFEIKDGNNLRLVYLETKTAKGSLTKEQKEFLAKKQNLNNVECYLSKSIEDSIRILEITGVLI